MANVDYDDFNDSPRPINLTVADPGYVLCPTCGGTGITMTMVCYGGPPVEKNDYCPDCDGEGQVPVFPVPEPEKQYEQEPIDIMKSIRDMFR